MDILKATMQGKDFQIGVFGKDKISDPEKLEEVLLDYFGRKHMSKVKESIIRSINENQQESSIFIKNVISKSLYQITVSNGKLELAEYSNNEYLEPIRNFLKDQPELSETEVETLMGRIIELIEKKEFGEEKSKESDEPSTVSVASMPLWVPNGFSHKEGSLEEGYVVVDLKGNEYIYCSPLNKYVSRFLIKESKTGEFPKSQLTGTPWVHISYAELNNQMLPNPSKYHIELPSREEYSIWWDWIEEGMSKDYANKEDSKKMLIDKVVGVIRSRNFEFPEEEDSIFCWTTSKSGNQQIAMKKSEEERYLPRYAGEDVGFRLLLSKK